MKILITNLPGIKQDENGIKHYAKAGSRWPMTIGHSKTVDYYPFPFWLAYTSALLKRDVNAAVKGLDGVVLDMDDNEYFREVADFNPDFLLTELTTISLDDDLALLKKIKKTFGCRIAVAGNYATINYKEILEKCDFIDFAIRKEYEFAAKEIVEEILNGRKNFGNILGISFRNRNEIVTTGDRPLLKDLNLLPYPDRDDFPATLYPDFTVYSPCISLIASRGCPGGCVYCQERHVMYNSPLYRKRDPRDIAREMLECKEKFGAKQFYFDDQSFTVLNKYTQEICSEIIKSKINVPWTCMGDAMWVNRDTLEFMAKAGCIGMKFGVESANPEILKRIGKPLDLEKVKKVVSWCKKLGIRTHATFCIGLPGETKETIMESIDYFKELRPYTAQVAKAVPYPGTPFYKWAKEEKFLRTDDLAQYDGMGESVVNYPKLSFREIDELYEFFSKKVSRQKLFHFVCSPKSSFSIMNEIMRKKGLFGLANSVVTVVKRAI